jgi:hypothetical protein
VKKDPSSVHKQSGKVTLNTATIIGNGTIPISAAPFPLKDTPNYQIGPSGDYIQEVH